MPRRYRCNGCFRFEEAPGCLCDVCKGDYDLIIQIYNRLRYRRPELRDMGVAQVFLHLANEYLKTP